MLHSFKVLKQALAYAKFSDKDIENGVKDILEKMGSELDNEGYEPNDEILQGTQELEDSMNNIDRDVENINDAINSAGAGDSEDEDEGNSADTA